MSIEILWEYWSNGELENVKEFYNNNENDVNIKDEVKYYNLILLSFNLILL